MTPQLSQALDEYEAAQTLSGVSQGTTHLYEYAIGGFGEYLGRNPDINDIEPQEIRGYLTYLSEEKGLAKTTVSIQHRTLQAFFNWLVRGGSWRSHP